ncbi:MAG: hypothetical protein ACREIV_08020, partial [Planctomycetaceae bacterium]
LYLHIAAEYGLPGIACFLIMVGLALRRLARMRREWLTANPVRARLATGFLLALVVYLTTGMFLHFSYARYFWILLALADAAVFIAHGCEPKASTPLEEARSAG